MPRGFIRRAGQGLQQAGPADADSGHRLQNLFHGA
jgi:hypothetical protein